MSEHLRIRSISAVGGILLGILFVSSGLLQGTGASTTRTATGTNYNPIQYATGTMMPFQVFNITKGSENSFNCTVKTNVTSSSNVELHVDFLASGIPSTSPLAIGEYQINETSTFLEMPPPQSHQISGSSYVWAIFYLEGVSDPSNPVEFNITVEKEGQVVTDVTGQGVVKTAKDQVQVEAGKKVQYWNATYSGVRDMLVVQYFRDPAENSNLGWPEVLDAKGSHKISLERREPYVAYAAFNDLGAGSSYPSGVLVFKEEIRDQSNYDLEHSSLAIWIFGADEVQSVPEESFGYSTPEGDIPGSPLPWIVAASALGLAVLALRPNVGKSRA
ncbi:MAG: hypothetical protein ACTSU5_15025 [Promethearchaeota archaeon]